MIYLKKNTQSPVILELTCISQLIAPSYLFEFKNDFNDSRYYFTAMDSSPYACRYNKFFITETGSTYTNQMQGIINLTPGSYTYNIYESSASTLSVSATTGYIVSTGKAFVSGLDLTINEIYR